MKTLTKSLIIAFLFTSLTVSFAVTNASQPKPTGKVQSYQSSLYTDTEGKIRVAVDKLVGGIVEVRLVNSTGKEFFVQRVGRRQRIARIKMAIDALPDGAYQVVVTDGFDTKVNNLVLTTQPPAVTGRLIALN
ncbi:hypothetical protein [Larkinella punicea]|uniref:Secretion system C-terminal sorting domain-containing protein n=1 Tax=Larkinella punicea TaxID=2315727 RepID=A0A368JLM4_9BACT|nr:hypothetical protein [Larkinella punicea]RCR67574.1 hypothetical protein DUE52_20950 [Larkinella punicea]